MATYFIDAICLSPTRGRFTPFKMEQLLYCNRLGEDFGKRAEMIIFVITFTASLICHTGNATLL